METVVRTQIVRIGNSQGVRLPKWFLQQSHLGEEVELELQEGQIVIRPARRPRAGWAEQFQEMATRGDDQLLDPEAVSTSTFDEEEWTW
jgi:antitoxin MazE